MKSIVVINAYYSYNFAKVFIGSFRKYYPNYSLLVIDNNPKGSRESKFLKSLGLIYLRNKDSKKTHGAGLDVALSYCYKHDFDLMITFDIDILFLKKGIIEKCEDSFNRGFKYGGWQGKWHEYEWIYPQVGFYDIKLLKSLGLSFQPHRLTIDNHMLDTAFYISYFLKSQGYKPEVFEDWRKYVLHFGSGSTKCANGSSRLNQFIGLATDGWYVNKRKKFFKRKDVKIYL